jgi:phenylacetate-CoA ligase
VLDKNNRLDNMTVLVEPALGANGDVINAAGDKLAQLIKGTIGVSATVSIKEVGGVERSLGKARRIIDNRADS